MKHGKHVLCEKPMASNAYEVKQMIAASPAIWCYFDGSHEADSDS